MRHGGFDQQNLPLYKGTEPAGVQLEWLFGLMLGYDLSGRSGRDRV